MSSNPSVDVKTLNLKPSFMHLDVGFRSQRTMASVPVNSRTLCRLWVPVPVKEHGPLHFKARLFITVMLLQIKASI